MKYESILSLVVVAWLAASLGLQAAAPTAQDASLRHLFATALDARDFEYQKVREEILVHKGAASFLAKQAKSTNLMVRVIGRAMLSWRNNSATSRALIERLAATVRRKQGSHIGESAILDDLYVAKSDPARYKLNADVFVILETALKGPSLPEDNPVAKSKEFRFLIRCYAAGLAGLYDGQDVLPVLVQLTDRNEDDLMRNTALRGLRLREDACLEIFLEGMEDQDQRYRKASYLLLRDISGQDFGHDPKRYRIWLETNAVKRVPGY